MPELLQFSGETLPEHYEWQIRDFVRIHWYDAFVHNVNETLHPPFWHPTYFIVAEQHALMSSAAAVWIMLEIAGQAYKTYGLSSVMTYPAFRKKGYGNQVVRASTDYIRQQTDADIALLWTSPSLEAFYNQSGWQHSDSIIVTCGDPKNPEPTDFPMMMFLSERASKLRDIKTFYFGEYTW